VSQDAAKRPRRPTLEDVGARAGVSRALVSIVMRGVPGASQETRERVRRVAEEMGYRPDTRARLLASTSRTLLGVVFSRYGQFHLEFLDGLYTSADELGADVILSALTAHRDESRASEALLDFRCDAVIQLGPEQGGTPAAAGRVPVVVVGWRVKNPAVDVVRSSDDQGALQAVDHLVELGHRDIVHVDGGRGDVASLRRRAYRAAMRRHQLQDHIREVTGSTTQEGGVVAARRLLDNPPLPTAVITFNDEVAIGLLETLRSAGVSVPGKVSIVGWDDSSVARLPHLDLTTVRQDVNELARFAVERCVARVTQQEIDGREIVLPTSLVVRGSTGPAPRIARRRSVG
jgi:DNA-binding LacI/PurR family transcriptional regulator